MTMLRINYHGLYPDWRSLLLWGCQGFRYTHVSISLVCDEGDAFNYDWTIGGMRYGEGDMPGIVDTQLVELPYNDHIHMRLHDVAVYWQQHWRLTWWRFLLTVLGIRRYPLCTDFVMYVLGGLPAPRVINCNELHKIVEVNYERTNSSLS